MHNCRTGHLIFTRYGTRVHAPLFERSQILLTQSVILFFNCASRKLYLVLGKLAPAPPCERQSNRILEQRKLLSLNVIY